MGKNKVMMIALGRTQDDEVKPNLSAVAEVCARACTAGPWLCEFKH